MHEVIEFRDKNGNITHFGIEKDKEIVIEFGTFASRELAEKYVDQLDKKKTK